MIIKKDLIFYNYIYTFKIPGHSETKNGYGEIGTSFYLQKLEQTCLMEPSNQLDDYYRSSLKDMRPDKPTLESDQTRYDKYSNDLLNLRHGGARVNTLPDLPDGTFLEFDGLNRDPRGIALDPDMKMHRRQQEARGKFIKFYSDGDNSVPSEGRSAQQVIRENKAQFYNVKDRMKIFEESQVGRQNAGSNFRLTTSEECMQKSDYRAPDMQDEICQNRNSKVNDLSMNTSIGYRRTTDHRFQVAHYGQSRRVKNLKKDNWTKNRSNTVIDTDMHVAFVDQNVSKSLALKMIDLSKKRYSDMLNGQNIAMEESKHQKIRAQNKIMPVDLSAGDVSQVLNNSIARKQHVTGNMISQKTDSNRMKKMDINPVIVKYMASANRKMTTKTADDLRDDIIQSAAFNGVLLNQSNKQIRQDANNELLWESVANFERGKSMKIANYGRNAVISGAKEHNVDWEEYKKAQKTSGQRRGNIQNPDMKNIESIMFDNDAGMEATGTKLIGGLGSKYTRKYIDKGDIEYETLSEVSCRN